MFPLLRIFNARVMPVVPTVQILERIPAASIPALALKALNSGDEYVRRVLKGLSEAKRRGIYEAREVIEKRKSMELAAAADPSKVLEGVKEAAKRDDGVRRLLGS